MKSRVPAGPKPLIEEHYHIEHLIDMQERRAEDRQFHKDRLKALEERNELIGDAKVIVHTDFHCSRCRKDFASIAHLQVEQDWSNLSQNIAFYKAKHRECGNWCIRLVTDKPSDAFWYRSIRVALERGVYHNDALQPHETGFNLLYGKGRHNK